MVTKEWVLNIGMFLLGTVFVVESLNLGLGGIHHPGAGFLPFFTGLGLACAAFFSLIKDFTEGRRSEVSKQEKFFGQSALNVFIIVIAMGAYVLILPHFGYILSTFLLLILLFKAGGFRKWSFIFMTALFTVLVSYWLFSYWLGLRFPKGFVGF
jgi:hypothetical protein